MAFVVDESASIRNSRTWLPPLILAMERGFLSSQLGTSRSCQNRYGVIGFGRRVPQEGGRVLTSASGQNMVSAAEAGVLALQLTTDAEGRLEDGYQALSVALDNLNFRSNPSIEKFVVLITDEDRDIIREGSRLTRQSISRRLRDGGYTLYAIVDNRMQTQPSGGVSALGFSWPGPWYTLGNCEVTQGGGVGLVSTGFSGTTRDYATLALEAGGAAFDIEQLRSTLPNRLCAFTSALEKAIVSDACRVDQVMMSFKSAPAFYHIQRSAACFQFVMFYYSGHVRLEGADSRYGVFEVRKQFLRNVFQNLKRPSML